MPNRMATQMVKYSQEQISVWKMHWPSAKCVNYCDESISKRPQINDANSHYYQMNKMQTKRNEPNMEIQTHGQFFSIWNRVFSLWFAFSCLFVYLVTNHKWIFQANIRIYEVSYLRIQIWCSVLSSHVQTIWKLALFTHCYYYFFSLSRWNKRKTEFLVKLNMLFNDTTEDILLVKKNTRTIFDDVTYLLGMNNKQTIWRKKIKKML